MQSSERDVCNTRIVGKSGHAVLYVLGCRNGKVLYSSADTIKTFPISARRWFGTRVCHHFDNTVYAFSLAPASGEAI